MRITLITILILLSFKSFSQDEQRKKVKPNRKNHFLGLSAGFGGLGLSLVSASIDAFIIKEINLEVGIGLSAIGLHSKTNYGSITHHNSFSRYEPNLSFFYGFGYASIQRTLQLTGYGKSERGNAYYITSGIQLISRGGFTFKLEMGPGYIRANEHWIYDNSYKNTNRLTGFAGFKIGMHAGGEYGPKPEKNISKKDFLYRQRKTKGKYQNEEIKRTRDHI